MAAGALGPARDGSVPAAGAVDPAHRGRGLGRRLLDWTLASAPPDRVTVGSEHVSDDAVALYRRYGLREVFAEHVMTRDLTGGAPERADIPYGVSFLPWTEADAPRFFAAYVASFGDRPGFPAPTEAEWIDDVAGEDAFDPATSALAVDATGRPAGFVAIAGPWVVQIGVAPAHRGSGVGDALLTRALAGVATAGNPACLLCVNVDNPAAYALYARHGFALTGRRGRYAARR